MLSDTLNKRRRVVVSGSSGLGMSFVAAFYRRNYAVFTCARDASKLRSLETRYLGLSSGRFRSRHEFRDKGLINPSNSRFAHQQRRWVARNRLTRGDLQDLDITAELGANLEGAIHLIGEFLPGLRRAGKASIVIVSSGYALAPATRAPIYSAAKAEGGSAQLEQIAAPAARAALHHVTEVATASCWYARRSASPGRENVSR
jgi:uncharacterized oxidoreductase